MARSQNNFFGGRGSQNVLALSRFLALQFWDLPMISLEFSPARGSTENNNELPGMNFLMKCISTEAENTLARLSTLKKRPIIRLLSQSILRSELPRYALPFK